MAGDCCCRAWSAASADRRVPAVPPLAGFDRERIDEDARWRDLRNTGSQAARDALFAHHASFARAIALRRFRERARGDVERAEFVQLAYVALLEAIDRFDPAVGAPFRAYAVRRIEGAIADGLRRSSDAREQLSWRARLRKERLRSLLPCAQAAGTLAGSLDAFLDLAMGIAIGVMLEETMMYRAQGECASGAEPLPAAYASAAWRELLRRLQSEIDGLDPRMQVILRLHYEDGLAFEQVGQVLGVSKSRVSQLHKEVLTSLRKRLRSQGHFSITG